MRKKIVAANWKMNMTQGEATGFVSTFLLESGESRDVEVVLVPPFTAIGAVNASLSAKAGLICCCSVKMRSAAGQNGWRSFRGAGDPLGLRSLRLRVAAALRQLLLAESQSFLQNHR